MNGKNVQGVLATLSERGELLQGGLTLTLIRTPLILILRDFLLFGVYLPTLTKESVLNPIFVYNSYYNTLL